MTAPSVRVTPATFANVAFDATAIGELTSSLAAGAGVPPQAAVGVEVDETTPLGRARLAGIEPIVLAIESGALEDPRRPRQFDVRAATEVIGRLLFEAADRLDPSFGAPPLDEDLPLPLATAWSCYAVGRLARLGEPVHRQRRLYHFRIRHGFTDAADRAFLRLWDGEGLTWAEVAGASEAARAAGGLEVSGGRGPRSPRAGRSGAAR